MASPSSPKRVRALSSFYENQALSGSRKPASGIPERDQQLIDDGLGRRINEAQQRNASQSFPPAIPPRPKRSVGKRADTAVTPAAEEDEEESESANPLSTEDSEPLTPHVSNVQELEQQTQQVHRQTEELTIQHRECEHAIQALNNQITTLEEARFELIAAGRALGAELKRQIDDLRDKLEQANLRESSLRKELEASRQMESDLRKQLAEAELQAIRQRRDSEAREHELQRQLRRVEREREEAAAQGQQGLVSGQHSRQDSGFQTPRTQQVVGRRSPDCVASIQEQKREDHGLGQENRELERARSVGRSEAKSARQERGPLQKKKTKRKEQRGEA